MIVKFVFVCALLFLCVTIGCSSKGSIETKSTKNDSFQVQERFVNSAQQMNEQYPIQADEITSFLQVLMSSKTMIIKFQIMNDYVDEIGYDE
jgi:hypothetical protein